MKIKRSKLSVLGELFGFEVFILLALILPFLIGLINISYLKIDEIDVLNIPKIGMVWLDYIIFHYLRGWVYITLSAMYLIMVVFFIIFFIVIPANYIQYIYYKIKTVSKLQYIPITMDDIKNINCNTAEEFVKKIIPYIYKKTTFLTRLLSKKNSVLVISNAEKYELEKNIEEYYGICWCCLKYDGGVKIRKNKDNKGIEIKYLDILNK